MIQRLYITILALLLSSCAMQQSARDLSQLQVEYQQKYLSALRIYTQGMLELSGKIKADAEKRIEALESENVALLEQQTAVEVATIADAKERLAKLEKLRGNIRATQNTAANSKTVLLKDFKLIEEKSNDLILFLEKLLEAQIAINNYIQTQKLSENISQRLFNEVRMLIPKVDETAKTLVETLGKIK